MIRSWKIGQFDNMEFNGADHLQHHFPDHFHYEYSIGLATGGLQKFHLQEQEYIVAPGSLVIINPEQIHAHYPIGDLGWSYRSMYVSPAFVQYLQKQHYFHNEGLLFDQPVISNPVLTQLYLQLHQPDHVPSEESYGRFMAALYQEMTLQPVTSDRFLPEQVAGIKEHLQMHHDEKLQLDKLASHFSIDKFQLIRLFKKHTGVTPNAYLTILRIEKAKQYIDQQASLVAAALEAGFYDQSHFHHNFLHYTGFTPRQYQQRNILQDPAR